MTAPTGLTVGGEFLDEIWLHFSSFGILHGYCWRRTRAVADSVAEWAIRYLQTLELRVVLSVDRCRGAQI